MHYSSREEASPISKGITPVTQGVRITESSDIPRSILKDSPAVLGERTALDFTDTTPAVAISVTSSKRIAPLSAAGNIHRRKYRSFWQEQIKPDKWVLQVLEEGYKLPFLQGEPRQAYKEKNNKSALDNMPFVRQSVLKYIDRGVVQKWSQPPLCISPLTVAARE